MNAFLKGFFNVPDGKIIDIFDFNTEKDDYYRSKETFDFIKAVYNLDIKAIISKSNKIVDDEYKRKKKVVSKEKPPTLADYFREMINQIDAALDITKLFEELELDDEQKEKVAKDHNGVKNRLDYFFVKEQSMEDIASHKIEYLLCNIYQIIMNVNFNESYDFIEYISNFKELVKEENEKDKRVSINSIKREHRKYYRDNILSYLFHPKEIFAEYLDSESEDIKQKLSKKYYCMEAMAELQIPSILHGASNVYRNNSRNSYSIKTISSFAEDYYDALEKAHNYYSKFEKTNECSKADIIHKYSDFSLYCNKYVSEMFYAFKYNEYFSEAQRKFKIVISKDEKRIDYRKLIDSCALTFLIPDINKRKLYTSMILNFFDKPKPDFIRELNVTKRFVYYEAQVYYPILVLSAIECIYALARRERKNAAKFFLENANDALDKLEYKESYFTVNLGSFERSIYAENIDEYYKSILAQFFNVCDYTIFSNKITTYHCKRNIFNEFYINELINKYKDEIDDEEEIHNGTFNTPYIVFRENLYEKLSDAFKGKLLELLYDELPEILHNELYGESDDENSDTEIEE